jgi:hypothetical protein
VAYGSRVGKKDEVKQDGVPRYNAVLDLCAEAATCDEG